MDSVHYQALVRILISAFFSER